MGLPQLQAFMKFRAGTWDRRDSDAQTGQYEGISQYDGECEGWWTDREISAAACFPIVIGFSAPLWVEIRNIFLQKKVETVRISNR
jgi:hypothetical protein